METHTLSAVAISAEPVAAFGLHAVNTRIALAYWREHVTPEVVAPGLKFYKCGTTHCFGGHLPDVPAFQALGVCRSDSGVPIVEDGIAAGLYGINLALALFGLRSLFHERGQCCYDARTPCEATDYELVLSRLYIHLEFLEEAA